MKNSKYVIYIVKAEQDIENLSEDDFGEYEDHDKIKRTIQWINYEKVFSMHFIKSRKLNPRIMSLSLRDNLKSIEKNRKYTKSLFK